ncbi:centromere protein F-like [Uloborus diversus]|uniref:centromere protein F-like n=1 Tax=Uloborus diversus TaxID=327109 RepID=UPI00240A6072|nr:centromere protein F-like [Uloborus diversus]
MCEEMKQKDLSIELLEAELDRAETTRQDILLKHSSERAMMHTEISQLAKVVESTLASAAQFTIDKLSIGKDVFEKIVSTYDNEVHSASERTPETICDSTSIKNSVENINPTNGELSDTNSSNKDNSPITPISFTPIGKTTPFRRGKQQSIGNDSSLTEFCNTEELRKASLKNELNKLTLLISKCGAATQFIQKKFISNVKSLNEEINRYAEELRLFKFKHYELKADFDIRKHIVEKKSSKIAELSEELRKHKKNHEEEKEKLLQKIHKLNEEVRCLDAINAEQSRQISNEVKQMINVVAESNGDFEFAQALSDRLSYKQEVAKLKTQLTEKEQILQQLAQKFERTTASLEENWHDAEKEVNILDEVIKEAYIILKCNPELVEHNEPLKKLFSLVCGKCSLSDIDSLLNLKEEALCT